MPLGIVCTALAEFMLSCARLGQGVKGVELRGNAQRDRTEGYPPTEGGRTPWSPGNFASRRQPRTLRPPAATAEAGGYFAGYSISAASVCPALRLANNA